MKRGCRAGELGWSQDFVFCTRMRVWGGGDFGLIRPSSSYLLLIVQGARIVGLPDAYVDAVRRTGGRG